MLYRSHRSEAAYELYTEALTVQNRVLDAHKILQSLGHAPFSSSSVSVVENTAKLSFNKVIIRRKSSSVHIRGRALSY